jgi:hypothetical protein
LLQIFALKHKARHLVQSRLLQSPVAVVAVASVTTAYAVITTTDEKPRDIVVTDDFDIKRTQPASNSKKIVAEIDVLTGQNVLTGQMILISRELNLEIKLSLC